MTAHREQNMKKGAQQDATIRRLLLTSVSTRFWASNRHNAYIKTPAPDTPDR